MKTIFILFVVITDSQGYEQLHAVSDKKHNSYLSCNVEQLQHKPIKDKISYFCADETKFFNKEQVLY